MLQLNSVAAVPVTYWIWVTPLTLFNVEWGTLNNDEGEKITSESNRFTLILGESCFFLYVPVHSSVKYFLNYRTHNLASTLLERQVLNNLLFESSTKPLTQSNLLSWSFQQTFKRAQRITLDKIQKHRGAAEVYWKKLYSTAYILWIGKQNQVQHYMCVDKSPCYSGLACKESQSIEQNWADCLEGPTKEKQTQALILSSRVWILLKSLKLPEKDSSKLLYGASVSALREGLPEGAWGRREDWQHPCEVQQKPTQSTAARAQ